MPFTKDGKRRELTAPEPARIIKACNRGAAWREIEKDFPVTARGAKKVFDRWMETKSLRRTKHKGRPKKLSMSDEQYLRQIVIRFPQAVTGAPCRKMDPQVATAPRTQSPLTIKVEIKIKFNSRIKR